MDTKELELYYIDSLIESIEKHEFTIKKLLEDKQESKDYYKVKRFLNKSDFDLSMEDIFKGYEKHMNGYYICFSLRMILNNVGGAVQRLYHKGYRK